MTEPIKLDVRINADGRMTIERSKTNPLGRHYLEPGLYTATFEKVTIEEPLRMSLDDIIKRLGDALEDPMHTGHAEVSKTLISATLEELERLRGLEK